LSIFSGTRAPELPLFGEQAREKAQAFYSEVTLAKLTPRERKVAEDAAELYRYFELLGRRAPAAHLGEDRRPGRLEPFGLPGRQRPLALLPNRRDRSRRALPGARLAAVLVNRLSCATLLHGSGR
jgi:hypothetical protein